MSNDVYDVVGSGLVDLIAAEYLTRQSNVLQVPSLGTNTLALLINNPGSRDVISADGSGFNVETNGSWCLPTPKDVAAMEIHVSKIIAMTNAGSVFLVDTSGSGVEISSWISENSGSVSHHFGGSCYTAADDANDTSRCADGSFRVVGTQNVYISDASLMKEGAANPCGFEMYIGHQAAKDVLESAFGQRGGR